MLLSFPLSDVTWCLLKLTPIHLLLLILDIAEMKQVIIALNCHTAALSTSSGKRLGIIVPFFGTEDDIAALLLALAIIQSDSSAEMVILSFLKPEKVDAAAAVAAATVAAAVGVSGIDTASGDCNTERSVVNIARGIRLGRHI